MIIEFKGRKPTYKQVLTKATKAVREGADMVEIVWGENAITLQQTRTGLVSWGWIKNISGYQIAQEITNE